VTTDPTILRSDHGPRSPLEIDVDPLARRALEFDELLEWVASFARTAPGAACVRARAPLVDPAAVAEELEAVEETRRFLAARGALVPPRLPDPGPLVGALEVEGLRLAPAAQRELARIAAVAHELASRLGSAEAAGFARLRAVGAGLADLRREARAVLDGTDPEGGVLDAASPELGRIRSAARRVTERLRRMLERMVHDPAAGTVIRDEFVTQRNGRFVIPVRADAPRAVRGIVHASSSSGATRFVEPLESVELNNEIVRLAEQEQEELERVLAAWSGAFRARLAELRATVEALSRFDDLQARALYAEASGSSAPRVAAGGPLALVGVRHPLLDRHLRESGARCVPFDLRLDPADRVLVLSGPNTGGKTVVLKTLGLSVLAAQAGIPVPAVEARLPLYRQVRADIGDHQSIHADLSTFSAHVSALAGTLAGPAAPALFLFDEIGTGTEPAEGAALARSILESLLGRGITAVATTHHGALKAWAISTPGAVSAAMEFDTATLRPTYRVLEDTAGTSAGLVIAERLGLDPALVERARGYLSPESREGERYLGRLRELVLARESEHAALARERQELAAERASFRAQSEREARELRERASSGLASALDELRRAGRRELAQLAEESARASAERRWSRAVERLGRTHAPAAQVAAPARATPEAEAGSPLPADPEPGLRVLVRSLGQAGEVVGRRGALVEVRLGGMTIGVAPEDLRSVAPEPRATRTPVVRAGRVRSGSDLEGPAAPRELLLLGRTVDDALAEIDRFLDGAALCGHDEVRIVHGHGTGRLRAAVRRFLADHVHVAGLRPGRPEEGGDGATVVTLA
jgi:DNA mismatch repair protein MutS2